MAARLDQGDGREGGGAGAPLGAAAIFDSQSLYTRAWFAARGSEELEDLSSCDAAACASLKILCSLLGRGGRLPLEPRRLLFCWDGEKRKTEKPRESKPDEFDGDKRYFRKLIGYLFRGAAQVVAEADDAVATAAYREAAAGGRAVVVSGDKDLQQLQRSSIRYYCLNAKAELDFLAICDRWHVGHPREVSVALAVIGDPKDGILGVNGLGPKKFSALRDRFPRQIPLGDLVEGIMAALPAAQAGEFAGSLEATLLRADIPSVPRPAPWRPAPLEVFDRVGGLGRMRSDWARLIGRC